MIKHNLKIHDTFLVTVEILSSNAIIVSANINSIIYRGALIQCNTSPSFLFKTNKRSENCFSAQRINLTEVKRNVRVKSFKSDYNLRRTNHKIIKAKQIICKSELKDVTEDSISNHINLVEPLSIKLKRLNGVYQNVDCLKKNDSDGNCLKRKLNDLVHDNTLPDHKRNIIKIKKIKLQSDQYQYSISTDEGNFSTNSLPLLHKHSDSIPTYFSPLQRSQASDIPPLMSAPSEPSTVNFRSRSPSLETISNPPHSDICDFVPLTSMLSNNIKQDPKISCVTSISNGIINTTRSHGNSLAKLKIVKNSCNSYMIKSTDRNDSSNIIQSRYNCKQFRKNDIIWAKLAGYSIWPAKVLDIDENDHVIVLWLGNGQRTSRLHKQKLWDFGAHFHEKFNRKAKGHYLDAVEQARIDYGKLDFNDSCQWHVDISSESSALESVNIDDSCYEFDRSSGPDLRTNVYLPAADEEFELTTMNNGRRRPASFLLDSPFEVQPCTSVAGVDDINI